MSYRRIYTVSKSSINGAEYKISKIIIAMWDSPSLRPCDQLPGILLTSRETNTSGRIGSYTHFPPPVKDKKKGEAGGVRARRSARRRQATPVFDPVPLERACEVVRERKAQKGSSLQHLLFPGGHPSKYWAGPTLLDFGDRTRTGVFNVVWS